VPKRIALFTPYSPNIGGAGTNYRSLLPHLRGAETRWHYLSHSACDYPNSNHLGPPILGGPILRDAVNSARLFVLSSHPRIDAIAAAMLDDSPDIVWVDAVNEGLLVGHALLKMGAKHLHVSVHDDPTGLAIKSHRYRFLAPAIERVARALFQRTHTIDTASEPLQAYYRQRFAVDSVYVYRYLDKPCTATAPPQDRSIIRIGHVGSAYSVPEVKALLGALRAIENADGVRFKVMTFGRSPFFESAAADFPGLVEAAGDVPEDRAVRELQQCRFVYSMYPFEGRYRIFRRTSQPTKMSTYLMAGRPILAHCPPDSSIVAMMTQFRLGVCVASVEQSELAKGVRSVLDFELDAGDLCRAIEHHCGSRNIDELEKCFGLQP
jgi:glycosyltransferase involved in cell wall biosynthesis